ncbi:MAG: hypothetical protein KAV25_00340 [Methanophagales archaeon]|nr:hypothetical protein [Methanophagales archaeon]
MKEKVLPYNCRCGGKLVEAMISVEHLGIDFGLRKGAVCTSCGDEYISDEVWEEIEKKAKELGLFGLERKVKVRKSGNSLVITLPPDIAEFLSVKPQTLVRLLPLEKGKLEIHVSE